MDNQAREEPPTLRRRYSIGATSPVVVPSKALAFPSPKPHHTTSLPSNGTAVDFELVSLKSPPPPSAYTSLKDLIPHSPTAVHSPTATVGSAGFSAYEISIRNRLVKQAAWAYLQPMSSSPDTSGSHFLGRLRLRFSFRNPIAACVRFFNARLIPSMAGAVDRLLRAIRSHLNR